jgi:hypothetical protein
MVSRELAIMDTGALLKSPLHGLTLGVAVTVLGLVLLIVLS